MRLACQGKILPWNDKYLGNRDGRGSQPYRCEKLDVLGVLVGRYCVPWSC